MATRGTKASGGTDFVTGYTVDAAEMNTDLNNAFTGINAITIADTNVIAGANIDPSKIGDYSADVAEYKVVTVAATRPAAASPDDFTTFDQSRPTTLEGEIERLRKAIDEIAGMVVNSSGDVTASEWYAFTGKGFLGVPCGTVLPTFLDTAPTGWLLMGDTTIGSAASGADYAAQDAHELYRVLWNRFSDTLCPVTGGRTTVDADFAGDKPLRLPLMTGRLIGIAGTPISANRVASITGTATAGSAAPAGVTITLDDDGSAPTKDDIINSYTIETTGGAGSGQTRTISDYVASTRVVTISVAWGTTTDNTTTYAIYKTVPTRAAGDTVGSDLVIPTLDTLAAHTHSNEANTAADAGASTIVRFNQGPNLYGTTGSTGGGSSYTQYPPTMFLYYMVKL